MEQAAFAPLASAFGSLCTSVFEQRPAAGQHEPLDWAPEEAQTKRKPSRDLSESSQECDSFEGLHPASRGPAGLRRSKKRCSSLDLPSYASLASSSTELPPQDHPPPPPPPRQQQAPQQRRAHPAPAATVQRRHPHSHAHEPLHGTSSSGAGSSGAGSFHPYRLAGPAAAAAAAAAPAYGPTHAAAAAVHHQHHHLHLHQPQAGAGYQQQLQLQALPPLPPRYPRYSRHPACAAAAAAAELARQQYAAPPAWQATTTASLAELLPPLQPPAQQLMHLGPLAAAPAAPALQQQEQQLLQPAALGSPFAPSPGSQEEDWHAFHAAIATDGDEGLECGESLEEMMEAGLQQQLEAAFHSASSSASLAATPPPAGGRAAAAAAGLLGHASASPGSAAYPADDSAYQPLHNHHHLLLQQPEPSFDLLEEYGLPRQATAVAVGCPMPRITVRPPAGGLFRRAASPPAAAPPPPAYAAAVMPPPVLVPAHTYSRAQLLAAELGEANDILSAVEVPEGRPYIRLHQECAIIPLATAYGIPPIAIALGASYFQRLMIKPEIKVQISCGGFFVRVPSPPAYLGGPPGPPEVMMCCRRGCSEDLRSVYVTCIYIAAKVTDRVQYRDMLSAMLRSALGSNTTSEQAVYLEATVLKALGWRLGPFFNFGPEDGPY